MAVKESRLRARSGDLAAAIALGVALRERTYDLTLARFDRPSPTQTTTFIWTSSSTTGRSWRLRANPMGPPPSGRIIRARTS